MSRHTELIDAVNDAKTEYDHTFAEGVLTGWRMGMNDAGLDWNPIGADAHTESRFPGRSCCCGVLLDWEPLT